MKNELESLEQKKLSRYVKLSIFFHVALLLAFTINATFFTEPPIQFEKAIRVDMVGLPEKPSSELPPSPTPAPVAKKEEAKPEPPPKKPEMPPKSEEKVPPKLPKVLPKVDLEAVNLDKTKNKQKQKLAMQKLKQMEALEEIQKDVESEKKKKTAQATAAAGAKYKGNVLAPGTELTGVNKLQADNYISDVHKHMIESWTLPA